LLDVSSATYTSGPADINLFLAVGATSTHLPGTASILEQLNIWQSDAPAPTPKR